MPTAHATRLFKSFFTTLTLMGTSLISHPAVSQTDSWNLSRDMMTGPAWPFSTNPTTTVAPATGVWSFAKSVVPYTTYSLLADYSAQCPLDIGFSPKTLSCWYEASNLLKLPAVMISPWNAITYRNNAVNSFTVTQGLVHFHPETNVRLVISWRSPIEGNVQILGRVADLDANCGDGVQWRILKAQGPFPIAATDAIAEPAASFIVDRATPVADWASVANLAPIINPAPNVTPPPILPKSRSFSVTSTSVKVGTEILVEFDKKENHDCDMTSLDLLISKL